MASQVPAASSRTDAGDSSTPRVSAVRDPLGFAISHTPPGPVPHIPAGRQARRTPDHAPSYRPILPNFIIAIRSSIPEGAQITSGPAGGALGRPRVQEK